VVQSVLKDGDVLEHTLRGNTLWAIHKNMSGHIFIACHIMEKHRGSYSVKSMSVDMHPYYYDCPLKYLDVVTCSDSKGEIEWRAKVVSLAQSKTTKRKAILKLAQGDVVKLVAGCKYRGVEISQATVVSAKPLVINVDGIGLRLRSSLVAEVLK